MFLHGYYYETRDYYGTRSKSFKNDKSLKSDNFVTVNCIRQNDILRFRMYLNRSFPFCIELTSLDTSDYGSRDKELLSTCVLNHSSKFLMRQTRWASQIKLTRPNSLGSYRILRRDGKESDSPTLKYNFFFFLSIGIYKSRKIKFSNFEISKYSRTQILEEIQSIIHDYHLEVLFFYWQGGKWHFN